VIAAAVETKGDRMNKRKKLVGTIAVGAALLVAPIAQARHGDDLTATHAAPIVSTEASSLVRPDDRAGLRGTDDGAVSVSRPDDRAGVRGYSSVPVHVTTAATSDGFDWIDALIGGVGGIATALLVMGVAFLLLSQRNSPRTA
jgi:hypothetical protein